MYSVAEVNPLLREKQFTGGGMQAAAQQSLHPSPAVAPSGNLTEVHPRSFSSDVLFMSLQRL